MNTKLKTFFFGILFAGSLLSAAPVLAWDWPWSYRDSRDYRYRDYRDYRYSRYPGYGWNRRQELRQELDRAEHKLGYDRAHHASREQLAHDRRRIDNLRRQLDMF